MRVPITNLAEHQATKMNARETTIAEVRKAIDEYIAELGPKLRALNKTIHDNPELAYEEHGAHDAICDFLESLGFQVTRHAYGIGTAFEALSGSGGRLINFNAEYDALPGIGHACGHNLIATASVTGFIALSFALKKFGISGRTQLLGTPAEESGGGKIELIDAGALKNVAVSLMMHPMSDDQYAPKNLFGSAGMTSIACFDIQCTYRGVSAHAGANPWEGVNALDAVVSAYNNISMLRQQIQPSERIHGAIMEAPKITNAIPAYTVTKYTIRSPTIKGARALGARVRRCIEAGALATGCKVELSETSLYADLRINSPLCHSFEEHMAAQGYPVEAGSQEPLSGSTDQGNVTYEVPGLHALIGVPVADGSHNHTAGFADAVGTEESHHRTIVSGKAMALLGWDVVTNDNLYDDIVKDFEQDKKRR